MVFKCPQNMVHFVSRFMFIFLSTLLFSFVHFVSKFYFHLYICFSNVLLMYTLCFQTFLWVVRCTLNICFSKFSFTFFYNAPKFHLKFVPSVCTSPFKSVHLVSKFSFKLYIVLPRFFSEFVHRVSKFPLICTLCFHISLYMCTCCFQTFLGISTCFAPNKFPLHVYMLFPNVPLICTFISAFLGIHLNFPVSCTWFNFPQTSCQFFHCSQIPFEILNCVFTFALNLYVSFLSLNLRWHV